MSSPTSDASSSRDTLDDRNEQIQQSTKDRRRERNRLAAQKHRLRRNERMSQLESQVLQLSQEKHALLNQIESLRESPSNTSPSSQDDPLHTRPSKRARTDSIPHNSSAQSEYVSHLEERILELERWTEELNGDLSDARDSGSRWRDAYQEEHHSLKYAEARTARLATDLRNLETERLVNLRELADLKEDLDTECGTVRSLRAENSRLSECLEGVEVALDLQRIENDKLRDRLLDERPRATSLERRLAEDLEDTQGELEKSRAENSRLRMALEDMRAHGSMKPSVQDGSKFQGEGSTSSKHSNRTPSPHPDTERYINDLRAKLSHTESLLDSRTARLVETEKEVDSLLRQRYNMEDHVSDLKNKLEKINAYLTEKGISLELE